MSATPPALTPAVHHGGGGGGPRGSGPAGWRSCNSWRGKTYWALGPIADAFASCFAFLPAPVPHARTLPQLLDAIVLKAVPIYWGCPRIDEVFDTSGFLIFETAHELVQVVGSPSWHVIRVASSLSLSCVLHAISPSLLSLSLSLSLSRWHARTHEKHPDVMSEQIVNGLSRELYEDMEAGVCRLLSQNPTANALTSLQRRSLEDSTGA